MDPDRFTRVDGTTWRVEPSGTMHVPVIRRGCAGYSRVMGADDVGTLAALGSSLIACSQ